VLFLGIVLDGVERGKPLRRIVGGELKLHQRGGDHALHAAIGAKLRDLAASGGAEHLAGGDVDQRQGIGVGSST
jgi:hypothetical protein